MPQQSQEKPPPPIPGHHVVPNHQGSFFHNMVLLSLSCFTYPSLFAPSTRFSLRPQSDENEGYGSSVRVLDELSPSFYRPKPQALPMGARPALPPPVLAVGDKPVRFVIRASIIPLFVVICYCCHRDELLCCICKLLALLFFSGPLIVFSLYEIRLNP